jgi:hypothetical protein
MPPFPHVYRTAIRMGIIGNLPGKTPEATMASALYTDIKKWKDGKAGSVFCRWVHVPAIPRASFVEKSRPKIPNPDHVFWSVKCACTAKQSSNFARDEGGCSSADVPSMTVRG